MAASDEANVSYSMSFETESSSEEGADDAEGRSGHVSQAVDSSKITPHKPPSGSHRRSEVGSTNSISDIPRTKRTATDSASGRGSKENIQPRSKKIGTPRAGEWSNSSTSRLGDTANFSDSSKIRDAVYSDWLESKAENSKKEKLYLKEKQAKTKLEEIEKAVIRQQRVKCVVEGWTKTKVAKKIEVNRKQLEELERKKKEEEDLHEKQIQLQEAARRWREDRKRSAKQQETEVTRRQREEQDRKQEDVIQKVVIAKKAFKAWSKQKAEVRKDPVQKKKAEECQKQAELLQKSQKQKEDAKRAFEAWKQKKDTKIRQTGLYSYHPDPRQPPKGQRWCPARSTNPKQRQDLRKTTRTPSKSKNELDAIGKSGGSDHGSYSSCSFESDASENMSKKSPELHGANNAQGGVSPYRKSQKKLKTIELCCQTLEYWCDCDDSDDGDEEKEEVRLANED